MIAAAYWWGWVLAHPVTLLVWGALAVLCVAGVAAYLRFTGEEAPRRASPCSRAGDARRHALAAACRRARAIRAWAWQAIGRRTAPPAPGPGEQIPTTRVAVSLVPVQAPALAPANRRDDGEGEGRAFHGLNHADTEPTRKATAGERHAAEAAATRPWADDTGSLTRFVEDGDRYAPQGGAA